MLFVGFQAEGTRGKALQDGKKEIKMLGEIIPVRAQVKTIDGFSAHADQNEIMRWLGSLKGAPRKVFVVHGEPGSSSALAALVTERWKWETEIPKNGEVVRLS